MDNIFEWLLARRKGGDFLEWAAGIGHNFSYATLSRAKQAATLTPRQKLMAQVAEQYKTMLEQRTAATA